MNNAKQVDELVSKLKENGVPFSEAVWQTALACVGWPYVFGAWGALCTTSERKQRYKYNNVANILQACQQLRSDSPKGTCVGCKWYPDGERVRCYDCRGFTDWCLKQFGFDLEGEGATGQWNSKKNWKEKGLVVEGIPQGVIVCLFYRKKDDQTKMAHTGLYFNGETCECGNGVQHATSINKKWTHWAVPAFDGVIVPEPTAPPSTPEKTLKKGDNGEEVKWIQNALIERGYDLGKWGADGSFGRQTEKAVKAFQKNHGLPADGIVNEATMKALEEKLYTVTIPCLPAEKADEIIREYGGSKKLED